MAVLRFNTAQTASIRRVDRRWPRLLIRAGLCSLLVSAAVTPAFAQVVERHLPSPPPAAAPLLPPAPAPASSEDDRPIGPALRGIVLLGADDPVASATAEGLAVARSLPRRRTAVIERPLRAFFGKPISRRLISRIEAVVVKGYRRQGFPFVEVSTPEQEISGGVVQSRVVDFHLGQIALAGAGAAEAGRIGRAIRLAPGDEIDTAKLSQDLDWLGRYPFQSIEPAFTPGAELGQTDLDLAVARRRPWQVQAGYSNSGASPTDQDRYFIGATVGSLVIPDSLLSLQITGSPEFWISGGRPFSQPHPAYESAAAQLRAPTGPRSDVEFTFDAVETNQAVQAFVVREDTLEAALAWREAVSNFAPLPGDVRLGIEFQSQRRLTFFGPTAVLEGGVNVYQLFAGWSDSWTDRLGPSFFDIAIHGAPGGIDRLDGDANLAAFTNGRVRRAAYVYADLEFSRLTGLGRGFAVASTVVGQYAGAPIPDTDQVGLGGQGLVRGYFLDLGGFDDALVVRDELRAPSLRLARTALPAAVAPFAFVDLGLGYNEAAGRTLRIASVGLGAKLQLGAFMEANLDLSHPLARTTSERADDWRLEARFSLYYF